MVKQLPSGSAIEKRSNELSLKLEKRERTTLLGAYLYKYAAIANRAVDEELIAIFSEALTDVPTNRLKVGLVKYLEEGVRFPWPSEIREMSEL